MNTWVVGHVPVGHYAVEFANPVVDSRGGDGGDGGSKTVELGEKVFFMKGRIMAGQASLEGNALGLTDFRWLAKEEVRAVVTPRYWSMAQDMLTER